MSVSMLILPECQKKKMTHKKELSTRTTGFSIPRPPPPQNYPSCSLDLVFFLKLSLNNWHHRRRFLSIAQGTHVGLMFKPKFR